MVAIPRLTVRTEYGSVLAVPHRGSLLFRNVPFAAPPFGRLRFLPPRPPQVWDGLRDGAEPGHGMPQPSFGDPLARYYEPKTQGEDALTVEVETPELGLAGLPVMVWFHGGGFVTGAGSALANDGYAFARDGIVHVSVNSRLGIDGYALLEDSEANGADNLGLRDQVAALEWVQRNIARFGGDPQNVTIAGQSTGASSVAYLLASPAARGLFVRAISQSGSPTLSMTKDEARIVAARIGELTGRAPRSDALRELDSDATRAVMAQLLGEMYGDPSNWNRGMRIPLPFCAVTGTEMLPQPVIEALACGSSEGVSVLAGTTKDETFGIFSQMFGDLSIDSPVARRVLREFGADADTVLAYRAAAGEGASDLAVLCAIATEVWARRPTTTMLEALHGDGFLYEFTWESPYLEAGQGSVQGIDIPFARDDFDTIRDVPRGNSMLGKNPSADLARRMHAAFVDFVKVGDPGWSPWSPRSSEIMCFDCESREAELFVSSPVVSLRA